MHKGRPLSAVVSVAHISTSDARIVDQVSTGDRLGATIRLSLLLSMLCMFLPCFYSTRNVAQVSLGDKLGVSRCSGSAEPLYM